MAFSGYYGNPYQQQMQYPQPQPQQVPQQTQTMGFVTVPNEGVARNYPVGPGISVSFKDESKPYVYTKTMGFSQFDQPIFKKYRLVEEEDKQVIQQEDIPKSVNYDEEIKRIWDEINDLKKSRREEDDGV